jgi:hypothetical protein
MQVEIRMGEYVRRLPSSWESAGANAWLCWRDLVRYGPDQGRIRALARLCGWPRRRMRSLSPEQIATLSQGTPWLELQPLEAPLRTQFYYRFSKYGMPAAKFEDDSALAFALADDFFQDYLEGDDEAQYHLFATLARPLRRGQRAPLRSREEALRRGRWLRNIGPEWLAATVMYWAGVKAYVSNTYGPWLFQQEEPADDDDEGQLMPDTSADQGPNFGWWGIFMDVAESGVFGPLESVYQTNFHEICIYLVKKEAERRRQEQQMNEIRNRNRR